MCDGKLFPTLVSEKILDFAESDDFTNSSNGIQCCNIKTAQPLILYLEKISGIVIQKRQ